MMEVIRMHRKHLDNIDREKLNGLEHVLDRAYEVWDRVIERGEKHGFRNAQATVLAPTGTIGFMMDCDTKGIEPEIGLVQTKLLAEGGTLRMVNGTVPLALERLGYNKQQTQEIIEYVGGHSSSEGAPHLKPEHHEIIEEREFKRGRIATRLKGCDDNMKNRNNLRIQFPIEFPFGIVIFLH